MANNKPVMVVEAMANNKPALDIKQELAVRHMENPEQKGIRPTDPDATTTILMVPVGAAVTEKPMTKVTATVDLDRNPMATVPLTVLRIPTDRRLPRTVNHTVGMKAIRPVVTMTTVVPGELHMDKLEGTTMTTMKGNIRTSILTASGAVKAGNPVPNTTTMMSSNTEGIDIRSSNLIAPRAIGHPM